MAQPTEHQNKGIAGFYRQAWASGFVTISALLSGIGVRGVGLLAPSLAAGTSRFWGFLQLSSSPYGDLL